MDGPRDIARGLLGPAYQPMEDFAVGLFGVLDPREDLETFYGGGRKVMSGDPATMAAGVADQATGLLGMVGGPLIDAVTTGGKLAMVPLSMMPRLMELTTSGNPQKVRKAIRRSGLLSDEADISDAADAVVSANATRQNRHQARVAMLPEGIYEDIDPLLRAQRTRPIRAEGLAKGKRAAALGGGYWSKKFEDEVLRAAKVDYGVDSAIRRAHLEAIPRVLKKEGWTVRHTSSGRDRGRASSRYLVSPDGSFEVRLSDHYLPDTPQRADRGGVTRWNDEIVVSGRESVDALLSDIRSRYAEFLE